MKLIHASSVILLVAVISACNPSERDGLSKATIDETPMDQSGSYTLGGDCNALVGTLTISDTSIRLTETVCDISDRDAVNSSVVKYRLSNCKAEGAAEADRTVTVSEVEDGMIEMTGWNAQRFMFLTCN